MKKFMAFFWVGAALFGGCGAPQTPKTWNDGINVTPTPAEMTLGEGRFVVGTKTVFVAPTAEAQAVADFFATKMGASTGFELLISVDKPASDFIELAIDPSAAVNDEGYTLDVTTSVVEAKAKTAQGLFYAMQTVMQLLPAEVESATKVKGEWTIPVVNIKDEPRFGYRGMHLDVCRHFVDVEFIKKQLDLLAMFKINKFHWHLTEDQGWRIEIKKYPRLTEVGAQRVEGEGNTYGPFFYTQDQVREVVAYAKERFIEVIPEIEMPGHGVAAIAAYPELSCRGEEIPVRNIWGVANDVYCAGNEQVFTFLEDVLTEVMPLFESEYFHIGGDECPKGRWEECPKCQAKIRELGLKDDAHNSAEMKLQSYFVQRIGKFLEANGKKMIGWDEILEGGLAPSATVMSWRGEAGGIESANMGHDVIMTPAGWMYLDGYQGDAKLLPVSIGGDHDRMLAKVYSYEPVPTAIDPDKRKHILGAQSNIWSEYKYLPEDFEHDIWPRIIATAELTWSPAERKNYDDFLRRLNNQRVRLDAHKVNYYVPRPEDKNAPSCNFVAFTDSVAMDFETHEPVAKIVYSLKSTGDLTQEFVGPMVFRENATLRVASVLPQGKMSPVRTITLEKQTLAPAVEAAEKGIKAEYYKGMRRTVAELEGATPDETQTVTSTWPSNHRVENYREVYADDFWSTVLTGYINVPEDGVWMFSTNDELWIDGNLLISNEKDNDGTARKLSRSDRSAALAKGLHSFKMVRMGAIFGGFPSQWENMIIEIRRQGDPKFEIMDEKYFF